MKVHYKIHRRVVLALCIVALVATVSVAQESLLHEDYEDSPLGTPTGNEFWTYNCTSTGSPRCEVSTAAGLDGTAQGFKRTRPSGTAQNAQITVVAEHRDETVVTIITRAAGTGQDGVVRGVFRDGSAELGGWDYSIGGGNLRTYNNRLGPCGFSDVEQVDTGISKTTEAKMVWTFNHASDTYSLDINDGAFTDSEPYFDCASEVDNILLVIAASGTDEDFYMDQIIWGGTEPAFPPEPEAAPEPSEFDAGLIGALQRTGFIEPGSQLLFVILVAGVSTVVTSLFVRGMSSGRFKNAVLYSVQAVPALFFIFIDHLEVWMYLLALLLGFAAVRGPAILINTYWEIRRLRLNVGFMRRMQAPTPQNVAPGPPPAIEDAELVGSDDSETEQASLGDGR